MARQTAGRGVAPLAFLAAFAVMAIPVLQCAAADMAPEQMEEGKKLFTRTATPACAVCHTLADAGASGGIGPSLDELKPEAQRVEKAVRNGFGQMPAYTALSDAEIRLLANYVATATSGAK